MIEAGVRLIGNVILGKDVSICAPAEVMAKDSEVRIGDGCDIAAYTVISAADSHLRCIGLRADNVRKPVVIEHHVFIGTGAVILGGTYIGHHAVIGAGVVLSGQYIAPYSKVVAAPPNIYPGHYAK